MRSFSRSISRIGPLPDEPSLLRRLGNVHWGPLLAALCLSIVGLVTVQSASSELAVDYFPRQLVFVGLGLVVLATTFGFDYHRLVDMAPVFYGISIFLLVLVLFVGREAGGAKSWLAIGPVGGQPSELAKLATALLLARQLATAHRSHLQMRDVLSAIALVALPVTLVALERDMGSAAMFLPMLAGVLLVAGIRVRLLVVASLLGLVLAAGLWTFGMKDYQKARIISFLQPEEDPLGMGYQVRQSKIAVGSGQWTGKGHGQGTQSQLRFLPARHTDFIMAVLAEEWGFLGVLVVLGLYGFYFFSSTQIAMRSRDRTGILLVVALLSVLVFHSLYNMAMVVGLLPITGIPLPFLSYGGSFTLINYMATGLILNVDHRRYVNR